MPPITPEQYTQQLEDRRRDRLVGHIARRDGVNLDRAKEIFRSLGVPDLIRLELECESDKGYTSEYDPLG